MAKIAKRRGYRGLGLIEIMIVITIVSVGILGGISYRYYCALDTVKADKQITAARIGSFILENWKATTGSTSYDPVEKLDSYFNISLDGPTFASPSGFNTRGIYTIVADNTNYYAVLSYKDQTLARPRILNVSVLWEGHGPDSVPKTVHSVKLTGFVD